MNNLTELFNLQQRAKRLEKLGQDKQALEIYLEIQENHRPNTFDLFERPIIILTKYRRYEEAIELCEKAIKLINEGKISGTVEMFQKRLDKINERYDRKDSASKDKDKKTKKSKDKLKKEKKEWFKKDKSETEDLIWSCDNEVLRIDGAYTSVEIDPQHNILIDLNLANNSARRTLNFRNWLGITVRVLKDLQNLYWLGNIW